MRGLARAAAGRVAALVVAPALVLAGCGGGGDTPGGATATGSASSGPARVTQLATGAVGVADVGGGAWTVLYEAGSVRTAAGKRIRVGHAPLRLVDTPGGVWVSVIRDGTVVRIDPTTDEVDRRVRLSPAGSQPEGLAWDGAHLWVVDQAGGRVVELDPAGTVVASYRTGAEPRLAAAGDGAVWIANYGGTSVSRVAHGRVRTVSLPGCSGPQGIAEAAGRVWVACTLSGKAVALDARTMRQVAEVPGLPDADAVVADGATVYVVGQSGPTVYAIGSRSGSLTRTVRLDDVPGTTENVGAAVVGSDLVVTQPDVRKVYSLPLP